MRAGLFHRQKAGGSQPLEGASDGLEAEGTRSYHILALSTACSSPIRFTMTALVSLVLYPETSAALAPSLSKKDNTARPLSLSFQIMEAIRTGSNSSWWMGFRFPQKAPSLQLGGSTGKW